MSDLLPPNATGAERAMSLATARQADVPVPVRDLWNPDTCPESLLSWLAWALSVDEWDSGWTDTQKRDTIRRSMAVHQYKGTIGAVRDALGALGVQARVQEWFNQVPAAAPYTFRVLLDGAQTAATQAQQQQLLDVLDRTKNLRSHLQEIEVSLTTQAGPRMAAVTGLGTEIVVTHYTPGAVVANETTIVF